MARRHLVTELVVIDRTAGESEVTGAVWSGPCLVISCRQPTKPDIDGCEGDPTPEQDAVSPG